MRRTPKQRLSFIKPDVSLTINIKESTDAMVVCEINANGLEMSDFNKGNAKTRMRMIAQYAIAGERKELSLVPTMRLKTLLASSPSTVMAVQTSPPLPPKQTPRQATARWIGGWWKTLPQSSYCWLGGKQTRPCWRGRTWCHIQSNWWFPWGKNHWCSSANHYRRLVE